MTRISHEMAKSELQPTIYTGTFIHTLPSSSSSSSTSTPIATLSVLENAAVFVDRNGIIVRICPNIIESSSQSKGNDGVSAALSKRIMQELQTLSTTTGYGWSLNNWVDAEERSGNGLRGKGGRWWFPGFVDTHIHASQHPNAGIFGTSTLLDWLNTYTFPLESSLSSLKTARRVYERAVTSTLAHGTTTAAYYATIHPESTNLLADICQKKGQRAFIGRVCMDSDINADYYRDASPEQAIKDTEATIDHIARIDPERSLIRPILTPRFAPSCSSTLLKALGDLAKSSIDPSTQKELTAVLPIQTHISENLPECALVSELFPHQPNYASVYDAHGLLTPKTVLAHAVHLSSEERRLIKDRECGISHCPVSNTSLSSGLCPVRTLLDEGVKVGLGTDVSGGCSSSVLVAAREAAMVSRTLAAVEGEKARERQGQNLDKSKVLDTSRIDRKKLTVEECLYLATVGGANILGLGHKVGSFEVGKEWDAQLIGVNVVSDDEDETTIAATGQHDHVRPEVDSNRGLVQVWDRHRSWSEKVAKWMFCGDDRNTFKVYVKGRLVHER